MFNYCTINEQGYCIGLSSLNGKIDNINLVLIDEYDASYMGRKYDVVGKMWTDEYYVSPLLPSPITNEDLQQDVLLNMELGTNTNTIVNINTDDTLMLMEMLIVVDAKLTQLLQPKVE